MLNHYHVDSDLHFDSLPWSVDRYYNHKVLDRSPENLYMEDGYNIITSTLSVIVLIWMWVIVVRRA